MFSFYVFFINFALMNTKQLYTLFVSLILIYYTPVLAQSRRSAKWNTEATDRLYSRFKAATVPAGVQSAISERQQSAAPSSPDEFRCIYPDDFYFIKRAVSRAHANGDKAVSVDILRPDSLSQVPSLSATDMKRWVDIAFSMGCNDPLAEGNALSSSAAVLPRQQGLWDYISRTAFMLQQGEPVVDYAVYVGEEESDFKAHRMPDINAGSDYDIISRPQLDRMFAEDGELFLPHVMQYLNIETAKFATLSDFAQGKIRDLQALLDTVTPDIRHQHGNQIIFSHRRTATEDIYFICNRSDAALETLATFRCEGTSVELWDAVTTQRYSLNPKDHDGLSDITLSLQPHQSFFVIFRHYGDASLKIPSYANQGIVIPQSVWDTGRDEGESSPRVTVRPAVTKPQPAKPGKESSARRDAEPAKPKPLTGFTKNWAIEFNMKLMHKPTEQTQIQKRAFYIMRPPTLTDWSRNSDLRIRYYSGTAIYRNTFNTADVHKASGGTGSGYVLNIQEAHDTVRVIVNGEEIGTLTHAPYQLDITSYTVQGNNAIELHVSNSTLNRMVGDLNLPEKLRVLKSVPGDISPTTPLLPSGIVGEVTVKHRQ